MTSVGNNSHWTQNNTLRTLRNHGSGAVLITWKKTSVYKPWLSAGDVTDTGHALWLDGNVACVIQQDSPSLAAMRMCFERACEQHSWNGAIDVTNEHGTYNLYVQVAGGGGAVDVSPNEMEVEVERGERHMLHGGPSAGETTRPTEVGVPSDGGEEAVAPRVPPGPSEPTQEEQYEHYATGHASHRSWCDHCVRGRGRVSPHVVAFERELLDVGVDHADMGPEGSQVTIMV